MTELVLSTIIVILLSGIFSGSETALFSMSISKAKQLYAEKKCSKLFLTMIEERDSYVSTLVFLNNIVNIAGSIYVGKLAYNLLGDGITNTIFSISLTMLIIIFAEILPKSIGNKKSKNVIIIMSKPLKAAKIILNPIVFLVSKFTDSIIKTMFGKIEDETISENEIRYLASTGADCSKSDIRPNEKKLINRSFDLHDTKSKDIMTPRIIMSHISGSDKIIDIAEHVIDLQHTRIVVIGDTIDHVLGFVLKSEILTALYRGKGELLVSELELHNVRGVDESISAEALMYIFKKEQRHLAIVRDEHDGVSGVVTLEDTLEVLIGEIVDETDKAEDLREVAADQKKARKRATLLTD